MTGYASVMVNPAEADAHPGSSGSASIEIRSVNSRFLDLSFKLADDCRHLEPVLREALSALGVQGLTVTEVSDLRRKMRGAGAGYKVAKNRLAQRALKGTKYEGLEKLFKGPTAIGRDNVVAVQFHPEKSHRFGMNLMANFVRWKP